MRDDFQQHAKRPRSARTGPFESGPIPVRPDGTFESPAGLQSGAIYRVAIAHEGFAPAFSDWVKLDKQRGTSVAVTLRPLVRIEGRVVDRQARPVAGVLIRQPGGGPYAHSDFEGRFMLEPARPDPSFLIARKPGFRFHGLAVGDHARPIAIVLTRESEPADSKMATLPSRYRRMRAGHWRARSSSQPCRKPGRRGTIPRSCGS